MERLETNGNSNFSLLGGPLFRFGCYTGLIRGGTETFPLGVAIGVFFWLGLVAVTMVQGVTDQLFTFSLVGDHVRLLVVIPLLFLFESMLNPRCTDFVNYLVRSKIVPERALPALEAAIIRTRRGVDSWLPEAVFLLGAIIFSLLHPATPLLGVSANNDPNVSVHITQAGDWYWIVSMSLFRFLVLRCLWQLGLWMYFLWRLSRLPLHLIPTHPDGFAGLGYLEVVHINFLPLVLAISSVQCSAFAEVFIGGEMAFEAIYGVFLVILLIDAFLFIGPLCLFSSKLWDCKVKGLNEYMDFAAHYVEDFEKKWIDSKGVSDEPLLGTADLQSLADLGNSVDVIREMGWVPVSKRLLLSFIGAALLPLLPLALFKYSSYELMIKMFEGLFGL